MEQLRFLTVVTTALVDSINPCAIGVLILLISTLMHLSHDRRRMAAVGLIYIAVIYVTYFLAGIGLLYFIQRLNIAEPLGIFVGALVIIAGGIEIKDFFWYGNGISLEIPKFGVERIKRAVKKATIPGVISLGFLVAAVELPCTGGPYLAMTTILAQRIDIQAIYYLLIYNFIFVLPLLVILGLAYSGTRLKAVELWKNKYRKWMRLVTGIMLIGLGVLLILFANGMVALGQ